MPKNFYKCNEGYNEICGDSIKIYLKKNSVYSQISISFTGDGCSISIAFTSIIVKFLNKFPISRIYEKVLFLRNFLTKSLVVPKS
ncbi:iron-sulfur cluster assembly scaffold protein [Candidatus Pinguicoccus supinus]|uniref:Iron-sulfur cluster assembly scaffold protein n=1 Tax=Candidatus Pinguicoccus supinus TaxID=2529394 RepID=A0A7T0BRL9_9BACT|nr:iron-sulfur cluster assembly scaffold protein [Candidatus Pinguicoccus supinus]